MMEIFSRPCRQNTSHNTLQFDSYLFVGWAKDDDRLFIIDLQTWLIKEGACSPKKWWPDYMLVDSVEVQWQGGKWGSTVYTPPSVYCPFQKCPQWLKLWMYSQQSKCFWNRFNALWPFWCDPGSDHAVPTAAMYSDKELSSYLVIVVQIPIYPTVFIVAYSLEVMQWLYCCHDFVNKLTY